MPASAIEREGRRSPLNLKTTPQLRAKLENAATTSGRTLSQEIEIRLERSFETDMLVVALVGDNSHSQSLLRSIAKTIERIEDFKGYKWSEDYTTLFMCRKAISRIMTFVLGSDRGEAEILEASGIDAEEKLQSLKFSEDFADEAFRELGQIIPPPPSGKFEDLPRRKEQPKWVRDATGRE